MHQHEQVPDGPDAVKPRTGHREALPGAGLSAALAGVPTVLRHEGVLGLQRTAGNAGVAQLLGDEVDPAEGVKDVIGGGGQSLDKGTRGAMEQSLGADFSGVRVHTDGRASESAKQLGAHAYTVGDDIAFQAGQYAPGTAQGQRMLAHELTHVVQQRSGPVSGSPVGGGIAVSDPSDRFEQEAERTADAVMRSVDTSASGHTSAAPSAVQRDAGPEEEELQMSAVQRDAGPEEEELQMSAVQRAADGEGLSEMLAGDE